MIQVNLTILGRECVADCHYEPHVPGRFTGPPELCYPDEGGYVVIEGVREGETDLMEWFEGLSEGVQAAAEETCFAACEELCEEADAWSGAMEDDDASS